MPEWTPRQKDWDDLVSELREIKEVLLDVQNGIGPRLLLLEQRVKWYTKVAYTGLVAFVTVAWDWTKARLHIP